MRTAPTPRTAVVFAGGDAPTPASLNALPPDALLIAADSGLAHAVDAGLAVELVVGDLDSVDGRQLDAAVAAGALVERHPADKDRTDLELALDTARAHGASRVIVVGAGGGRLDHFLANALLLGAPEWDDLELEARIGPAVATVIRREAPLHGTPGDLVTLLALGGPARGVRTEGLRWALLGEDLRPGSSRGVSNELVAPTARVTLTDGVLLAIAPHATQPPARDATQPPARDATQPPARDATQPPARDATQPYDPNNQGGTP